MLTAATTNASLNLASAGGKTRLVVNGGVPTGSSCLPGGPCGSIGLTMGVLSVCFSVQG